MVYCIVLYCLVLPCPVLCTYRICRLADSGNTNQLSKQNLEINPSHPIVRKLAAARTVDADAARDAAEQVCNIQYKYI